MLSPNKKQKTGTSEIDVKTLTITEIVSMAVERKLPGWYWRPPSRGNGHYLEEEAGKTSFTNQLIPYLNENVAKFKGYTRISCEEVYTLVHSCKEKEKEFLLTCKDLSFIEFFLREDCTGEGLNEEDTLKLLRSRKSKQRIAEIISPEEGPFCTNQFLAVYLASNIASVHVVKGEDNNTFHVEFASSVEMTYKLDFFDDEDTKRLFFRVLRWSADFELDELDWDVDWSPSMKKRDGTTKYIYGDLLEPGEIASETDEEKDKQDKEEEDDDDDDKEN